MRNGMCRLSGDPTTLSEKATKWLRKVVGENWSIQVKYPKAAPKPSIEVEFTTPTGERCVMVIDASTLTVSEDIDMAYEALPSSERTEREQPTGSHVPNPVVPHANNRATKKDSQYMEYSRKDVISVSDPLMVPLVCGRANLRAFLHPFCGADDAKFILYKGEAIDEDTWCKIAQEEQHKSGKKTGPVSNRRHTQTKVLGVTGSEFPVQEWLKQVGALYGETVVGQRLACYWEEFDFFYPGIVHGFNRKSGSHLIVYDDGDKVNLHLVLQKVHWLRSSRQPAVSEMSQPLVTPPDLRQKGCGECDGCEVMKWIPGCEIPCKLWNVP